MIKPRVAIAGFLHESNTFNSILTTLDDFGRAHLDYGSDLLPVWREAHHELGGFIAGLESENCECIPLLAASATPGGPLTSETYDKITEEIIQNLKSSGSVDALLLALHGAMVSEDHLDADGETVERIRREVGPDLPIMLTLDMHANLSPRLVNCVNSTIIYRTYPHIDQRDRGLEAARLITKHVRGDIHPVQTMCKPGLLMHIVQQYSEAGAMEEIKTECERLASRDDVLSASYAPGYIYADVPDMGSGFIVVTDDDLPKAKKIAGEFARFAWDRRDALNARLPTMEKAVMEAKSIEGLVSLMDCGDNIGGGGPGDSTHLLHALRRHQVQQCLAIVYDPKVVEDCLKLDPGELLELQIGGKTDNQHGAPLHIQGRIRSFHDGRFIEPEPRHGGVRFWDQGKTVVIDSDEDDWTIVLNSKRVAPMSLHQLLSLGIQPQQYQVVVVKGVTAPRAAYDPISSAIIPVDTPGVTQAGPETFSYKHRPKPLFPLDNNAEWRLQTVSSNC